MARITIDVDLPPEVEITGYQRYQDGHGLEVRWPLPARCRCEKCGHDDVAHIEFKIIPQAIRDLNLWEQPCFWIYQAPFHRCARCNYRQHIIPPFKRKDVSYTYRFEQFVLRSLIGSTAEEVARRLGISAETVDRIVENQLTEDRQVADDMGQHTPLRWVPVLHHGDCGSEFGRQRREDMIESRDSPGRCPDDYHFEHRIGFQVGGRRRVFGVVVHRESRVGKVRPLYDLNELDDLAS